MGEASRISGKTKVIAVVGTPIEHSLSPAMHNTSFEHLGIDCVFLASMSKKKKILNLLSKV